MPGFREIKLIAIVRYHDLGNSEVTEDAFRVYDDRRRCQGSQRETRRPLAVGVNEADIVDAAKDNFSADTRWNA